MNSYFLIIFLYFFKSILMKGNDIPQENTDMYRDPQFHAIDNYLYLILKIILSIIILLDNIFT